MSVHETFKREVASWPDISVHSHRFGGWEFRFKNAEVGHIHEGGVLDIPFPRGVRDRLLALGLAEEHHWVPNSGWITFRIQRESGLPHAFWLMRLSYLRYALKHAADPHGMLQAETQRLHRSDQLQQLLQPFLRTAENPRSAPAPFA